MVPIPHTAGLCVQLMLGSGDLERPLLQRQSSAKLRRQHLSHWHVPSKAHLGGVDPALVRAGFVRKVYGIVMSQLLFTCAVCAAGMYIVPLREFFVSICGMSEAWWFKLSLFIPMFASLLFAHSSKTRYPYNYIALLMVTLCTSFPVALVCALLYEVGLGTLVLISTGLTAGLFAVLSLCATVLGRSLSCMGSFLACCTSILCCWGFAQCFLGMGSWLLYPVLGALTFCGYITYDTWRIMEVFGCDDYITAAIELYLDIINLFLYILQILLTLVKAAAKID